MIEYVNYVRLNIGRPEGLCQPKGVGQPKGKGRPEGLCQPIPINSDVQ